MLIQENRPVALVIGASRGIGRQVAIDLAKNGYRVIVAAKTVSPDTCEVSPFPPDPNSKASTISTVAREISESGGIAHAIQVDVRFSDSIQSCIDESVRRLGRLDVLVYNAGAIWWSSIENTPLERFKLMQHINPEGLYAAIKATVPYFEKNVNGPGEQKGKGRIIVVSPPIYSRFFRGKTAYAMGKVGMSVLTKGLAMDWKREGRNNMAITSIWPATAIQSAATPASLAPPEELRKPTIFSDAILAILQSPVEEVSGTLELDEDFLRRRGVTDFAKYSVIPGTTPRRIMPAKLPDLTVAEEDDEGQRIDSTKINRSRI